MTNRIFAPKTRKELLAVLSTGARPLAGGTDYFAKGRPLSPHPLVFLGNVPELSVISETEKTVIIGAAATMNTLSSYPLVQRRFTALALAAGSVGSLQIRNGATLGGNLANGSPAADTPPSLLALDARATLLCPRGERSVSVESLINKTDGLAEDEIIWSFSLPKTFVKSTFCKLGSRKEVTISRVNLAVAWNETTARVAVGTLGNAGRLCPDASKAWISNDFNAFTVALQALAETSIAGRSTLPYKRRALVALAQDLWKEKEVLHD